MLVASGADINATNIPNDTPLTWASYRGKLSVVQSLCQLGSNVNHKGYHGQTPLHRATDQNRLPTVRFLLTQRPDLNIADDDNLTVLQLANQKGYKEIADIILSHIGKTQIGGEFLIKDFIKPTILANTSHYKR